ncbi:MAG: flagellin [Bacteriovoracaceae bacterium]|jgi:flagellin|nr:flagellin FliC [Halobacteriovoraceae bacterium]MDP7321260.1 flagellin [Bacteriovoracaceae bacterium]|tara:strand:- start:28 stop:864 length:837 start_codon:yes stop_codon:yes gene_type:complete
MGLRIKSNVASQMVQKDLKQASQKAEESYAKLSSGKRITKSADDAAGLGIAKKMEAEVRGYQMAQRNANAGISMIQVAEGGLDESSNILTRMRELSIQAASDTVGERERGYLNLEYEQLVQEVDRISKVTTFSGAPLLTGENENGVMDFHIGAYSGEDNKISFDATATNATADALAIEGTNILDKENASSNLEVIDEAINQVAGFRANFGSIQSRLQSTISNLDTAAVNTEAARSRIEDVDVAAESAKLAANNVMKSAGISSLAQANNIPNSALRLIG